MSSSIRNSCYIVHKTCVRITEWGELFGLIVPATQSSPPLVKNSQFKELRIMNWLSQKQSYPICGYILQYLIIIKPMLYWGKFPDRRRCPLVAHDTAQPLLVEWLSQPIVVAKCHGQPVGTAGGHGIFLNISMALEVKLLIVQQLCQFIYFRA